MELPEEEAEWPLYQHVNATCLVAHHTIFEPPHMRLADCSNRGRIAATPTTFGPEVQFEEIALNSSVRTAAFVSREPRAQVGGENSGGPV